MAQDIYIRFKGDHTDLTRSVRQVERALGGLDDTAKRVGRSVSSIDNNMSRMDSAFGRAGRSFGVLKGALAGGLALVGTGALLGSMTDVYTAFESNRTILTTYLGSQDAANKKLQELKVLADGLPQDLGDITNAFTILTRTGVDTSAESLTAFSNIATANGKSLEQLAEAVADGMTGEFERMKEFGIKVSKEGDNFVARIGDQQVAISSSTTDLMEQLKALGEEGGKFGGAAAANAGTLSQSLSNLKGATDSAMISFMEGFSPAMKGIVDTIAEVLKANAPLIESIGEKLGSAIQTTVEFIGSFFSSVQEGNPYIEAMRETLGYVGEIFGVIFEVLGELMPVFAELSKVLMPLLRTVFEALGTVITEVVVPAIKIIVENLAWFIEHIVSPLAENLLPVLSDVFSGLANVVGTIVVGAFEAAKAIMETIIGVISTVIDAVGTGIAKVREFAGAASNAVSGMKNSMVESARGAYNGVTGWFNDMYHDMVGGSIIPDLVRDVTNVFSYLPGNMGNIARSAANTVVSTFNNLTGAIGNAISVQGQQHANFVANVGNTVNQIAQQSMNVGQGIAQQGYSNISNILGGVVNSVQGAVNAVSSFGSAGNRGFMGIVNTVGSVVGAFQSIGSLFGLREEGGMVRAGGAYIVGESGPELFTPSQSGSILPNDLSAPQAQSVDITFNINAIDTQGIDELLLRRRSVIQQVISDAMLEAGTRSRF